MTTAQTLVKLLLNTDDEILIQRFIKYFSAHLSDLKDVMLDVRSAISDYETDVIYDNDVYFLDDIFAGALPSEVIQKVDSHYQLDDDYAYEDEEGNIHSCQTLQQFFTKYRMEVIAQALIYDLTDDDKVDFIDPDIQRVLLKSFQ